MLVAVQAFKLRIYEIITLKGMCFRTSRRHSLKNDTTCPLFWTGFSMRPTSSYCPSSGTVVNKYSSNVWRSNADNFHLTYCMKSHHYTVIPYVTNPVVFNLKIAIVEFILRLSLGEANELGAFYWSARSDYLLFTPVLCLVSRLADFHIGRSFQEQINFMDPKHSGHDKIILPMLCFLPCPSPSFPPWPRLAPHVVNFVGAIYAAWR